MQVIDVFIGETIKYPVGENIEQNIPVVQWLAKKFIEHEEKKPLINLFCMGSSGVIMAAIFATIVPNVMIHHIKKDGEESHSKRDDYKKFIDDNTLNIIIDDFIVTGNTLKNIYDKIGGSPKIHYLILGYGSENFMNKFNFTPEKVLIAR